MTFEAYGAQSDSEKCTRHDIAMQVVFATLDTLAFRSNDPLNGVK